MKLDIIDEATSTWLIDRCPHNDGLANDTVQDRNNDIINDGWIPDLRSGAWVRGQAMTLAVKPKMKCLAFHHDSLIRGLEAAYHEQPDHPHVRKALAAGIKHCKVYHPMSPTWAVRALKKLGNSRNSAHRVTNLVDIYIYIYM